LYDAKAPNCQKNKAFKELGHYSEWPKVADAVIQARSALSDPDRSGQTGQTAASAPAVPTGGRHPQKALFPYLGKGSDVS